MPSGTPLVFFRPLANKSEVRLPFWRFIVLLKVTAETHCHFLLPLILLLWSSSCLKSQQNTFSYLRSRLIFIFSPLMKNNRPLLQQSLTPSQVHFQILIYDDTLLISATRQICSVNNLPWCGGDAEQPGNVSDTIRKLICRQLTLLLFCFSALV